jgi:hypothetical protein
MAAEILKVVHAILEVTKQNAECLQNLIAQKQNGANIQIESENDTGNSGWSVSDQKERQKARKTQQMIAQYVKRHPGIVKFFELLPQVICVSSCLPLF